MKSSGSLAAAWTGNPAGESPPVRMDGFARPYGRNSPVRMDGFARPYGRQA